MIQKIGRKRGEEFSGNGQDTRGKEGGAKRYHQWGKVGEFVSGAKVFENSNELLTVRRDNLEANGGKRKCGIRSKEE